MQRDVRSQGKLATNCEGLTGQWHTDKGVPRTRCPEKGCAKYVGRDLSLKRKKDHKGKQDEPEPEESDEEKVGWDCRDGLDENGCSAGMSLYIICSSNLFLSTLIWIDEKALRMRERFEDNAMHEEYKYRYNTPEEIHGYSPKGQGEEGG